MALLSDYTAGTVSVAAGGTAVTGVGTAWLTAGFAEGDEFFAPGWHGIVQSVNSNTSLTLYPTGIRGAALAGAAYRLRYQGDGSRLTAQARQLIELLGGSGNFQALAALDGAADKLPFFTGAGTMDVTTISSFVRSIIDEVDAPNFLGALGAGAKGRDVLASTDMLNLLGRFGPVFGGLAPQPVNAGVGLADGDFNTVTVPGVYTIAGAWSNGPEGTASTAYAALLEVQARSFSNLFVQIVRYGTAPHRVWRRRASSDLVWSVWERIENPTVGTVAVAGGVPTGAIIERGSNANGEYARFADGTQICWTFVAGASANIQTGAVYYSGDLSWTFPAVFVGTPSTHARPRGGSSQTWCGLGNSGDSSSTMSFAVFRGGTTATVPTIHVMAIGRWF